MSRSRACLHRGLIGLGAMLLAGCVTTTSLSSPRALVEVSDHPQRLLVRSVGDSAFRPVIQYRATTDSLIGVLEGSAPPGQPLRQLAVPYDSIVEIRVRRSDFTRVALIPAVPVAMGAMVWWILGAP